MKRNDIIMMIPYVICQVVPEDLYRRLEEHLDYVLPGSGLITRLDKMRPLWVALTLMFLDKDTLSTSTLGGGKPLDLYLRERAKVEGKQIHGVETLEYQCNLLNGMDDNMNLFILNETLNEKERLREGIAKESSLQKIIDGYRQRNLDPKLLSAISFSTKNASSAEAHKVQEYFQTNIIVKRNKNMAARIIELLKEEPDAYFFAFGLAHFIGEDGIPEMIRSAGFHVEEVYEHTPRYHGEDWEILDSQMKVSK